MPSPGASGSTGTGVAGSLAINVGSSARQRQLFPTPASVEIQGGSDLNLTAENTFTNEAKATAAQTSESDSGDFGMGASVALNVGSADTFAKFGNDARVISGGDVTLTATGSHTTDTLAEAGGQAGGGTGIGGAVAITVADGATEASIGGGGIGLTVSGDLKLDANHSGVSTTKASGSALGADTAVGAAIALSFVNDSALATTSRGIAADGAVTFSARGNGSSKAEAIASAAGTDSSKESAKGNSSADDQATKQTDFANKRGGGDNKVTKSASTDDGDGGGGSVSVGAALALNVASSDAVATIGDNLSITAGSGSGTGALTLHAENNMDASAIADGSAAGGEGATSVGVAVALNIAFMENTATVGTGVTINADGFKAEALMKDVGGDKTSTFAAKATSGASGGDTGIAGSFALNYSEATSKAVLPGTVNLTAGGGDITLSAESTTSATVEAKASADSEKTGVGVSVGLNIATNNDALAKIENGAIITGGANVSLSAEGSHVVNTEAIGGGKSKSDTGVGGALAITVAENMTEASVGTGGKLDITGAFKAEADHHGKSETVAKAAATGGSTAVGVGLALGFVNDSALATTTRDITADGAVTFSAKGDGSSKSEAIASSAGADTAKEEAKGNTSADDQTKSATGLANQQGGGGKSTDKKASTDDGDGGGGSVSVGAALALNVASSDAVASIGAGRTIVAGDGSGTGLLTLHAENNMDASAIADGSAAGGEGATSVGVAVALNIAFMENTATVGAGTTVTADGFKAEALMKDVGGDKTSTFLAKATSGASGGDTGVAGSFALNYSEATTKAVLPGTVVLNAGSGDVTLSAENTTSATVEAKASADSEKTGVGVSVALNIATNNDSLAKIENGAVINGGGNVSLSAEGSHVVNTEAIGGGKSKSDTGIGGALAITVAENVTEASVGTGGKLDITGAFKAEADHHGKSETVAKAAATGGSTAVGVGLALGFVNDSALATTTRDITADGAVSFSAKGDGSSKSEAIASSAGADTAKEEAKGNTSADDQTKSATGLANKQGGGGKSTDKKASTDDGDGGGGSVSVGAALALNVASSETEASIGAGRTIVAGDGSGTGLLTLHAENNMDASAIADGSAAGGKGATSVGVAVALNIAFMENTATVGTGVTITADGFKAEALMKDVGGDKTSTFLAKATSGASGGDTGVAGSFALNYSEATTKAVLPGTVVLNAGAGDITLSAENVTSATVEAKASADSEKTGVGVSVGLNIAIEQRHPGQDRKWCRDQRRRERESQRRRQPCRQYHRYRWRKIDERHRCGRRVGDHGG